MPLTDFSRPMRAVADKYVHIPATVTIFKEGEYYFAVDWSAGVLVDTGTDAATVIQSAIDYLANGGKIFIRHGEYTTDKSLQYKPGIVIEGEVRGSIWGGATTLKYTPTSGALFESASNSVINWGFTVKHLVLEAQAYSRQTCALDIGLVGLGCFEDLFIRNFGTGISIDGEKTWGDGAGGVPNGDSLSADYIYQNSNFEKIIIRECYNGIRHIGRNIGNNAFYNIKIFPEENPSRYGIYLHGSSDGQPGNNGLNKFYGVYIYGNFERSIYVSDMSSLNEFYGLNLETSQNYYAIYVEDPPSAQVLKGNIFEGEVSRGKINPGKYSWFRLLKTNENWYPIPLEIKPCENTDYTGDTYEMSTSPGEANFHGGVPITTPKCYLKTPDGSYDAGTVYVFYTYWYLLDENFFDTYRRLSVKITPVCGYNSNSLYGTWGYVKTSTNRELAIRFNCTRSFTGWAQICAEIST